MARDIKTSLNIVKKANGNFTETGEDTLLELLDAHFPHSEKVDPDEPTIISSTQNCNKANWDVANSIVTVDKVSWAIDTFCPFKSPGLDGITPILLQRGKDILIPTLCKIYRASLAYGYVPRRWRHTKVVFLPKSGKDNYYEVKSFRPISLTSFLLKILEKLIDRHIREYLTSHKPLSNCQHAYQPGKSCDTALYSLTHILEKSLNAKEIAMAVFLDIEGAFDKVPTESILRALRNRGADSTTTNWIHHLLSDRIISSSHLGDTIHIRAKAGCPQGGVLSPLLWCLVVDTLLEEISTAGVKCIGYADDIAIIVCGKFENIIFNILGNFLKKVENWCNGEGLTVNPDKTTLVAFTNRRALKPSNLKLYGKKLSLSNSVKYLGVYFDSKLSWKKHQDYCISKAKKIFWSCRNAIGKTWGLSPQVVHWIYSMIICPLITYGAIAWWSRVRLEDAKKELYKVQRMICISITGALRTTPTATMELLLDMYPLHMKIEAVALTTLYRLRYMGQWLSYSNYLSWRNLNSEITNHHVFNMKSDEIPIRYIFNKPFELYFPARNEWKKASFLKNGMTWFTDGSKMGSGTGAGVCCPVENINFSFPMGMFSTVFQAEIYAILMCCNICMDSRYRSYCINICSDSQAALMALNKRTVSSGIVNECYDALCALTNTGSRVRLFWVPGHTGIRGNELADSLARNGSCTPFVGPEPFLGITRQCIKSTILKIMRKKQYHEWLKSCGQRQSKELNSDHPDRRAKELFNLSRNNIRKSIGLLTGHCGLKRHLHIMGIASDPICRGCNAEEETAAHILCKCDYFSAYRFEHLGRHSLDVWEVQNIPIRDLLKFISATGLLKD